MRAFLVDSQWGVKAGGDAGRPTRACGLAYVAVVKLNTIPKVPLECSQPSSMCG